MESCEGRRTFLARARSSITLLLSMVATGGARVKRLSIKSCWGIALPLLIIPMVVTSGEANTAGPPGHPLYWCPDKPPDQQLGAAPEPGCTPLVEKDEDKETDKEDREAKVRRPIEIENIEREVPLFLQRYRQFLDCCVTDLGSLEKLEDLKEQASDLLKVVQTGLFSEQMKLRGFTLRELISPVARARDDLRNIKRRLEQIREAKESLETLDYELAGRERRRILHEEESIKKEFRPRRPPEAPPTGREIGVTPPAGPEIGTVPPTGTEIGTAPPTGPDIGVTPPTGKEIDHTPPTGFEIGTTGQVGSKSGDSGAKPEKVDGD